MKSDDRRRAIGKLISVASDKFVVELHRGTENFTVVGFDDVHCVARLGSFVILPIPSGYVVAEVVGLRDKDAATTRQAGTGSTEIDKATSAKYLDTVPLGTLPQERDGDFIFGVSVFPSLYTDALYVLDSELDRIFDVAQAIEPSNSDQHDGATRYKALTVGKSVIFPDYDVKCRIDSFFGGHAAVLGNTGSGKSCTVATILQSLFTKPDEHVARGATFVILDVNGEYAQAFAELPGIIRRTHFYVSGTVQGTADLGTAPKNSIPFRLPHWFMSVEEWELLLRASERTQQPVLRTALGLTTLFADGGDESLSAMKNHIIASCFRCVLQSDANSAAKANRISSLLASYSTEVLNPEAVQALLGVHYGDLTKVDKLNELLDGCILENVTLPGYAYKEFAFESLGEALELALLYEESHGNKQIRDYCSQMITRFKWIREREEFAFLRYPPTELASHERNQDSFIDCLIGSRQIAEGDESPSQIVILDMNDAADEVVEVASAVISRLIFERLRRDESRNSYPVHVILEEAHRYVAERKSGFAMDASKVFERIAKEGRKYGMFLMVASQRPSELSSTVLSQCSNFVIHRIQNPDDLHHIRQMTPFISDSVLRRLPSRPTQHALIFGSAVNLPTTFRVRDVSPKPKSDDAQLGICGSRTSVAEMKCLFVPDLILRDTPGLRALEASGATYASFRSCTGPTDLVEL